MRESTVNPLSLTTNDSEVINGVTPSSLASPTRQQLLSPESEPTPMQPGVQRERKLATLLYLVTTALLYADQNLLSPNLSAIAAEFQLDDIERDKKLGGDIAIAFWMVGVPASIVVGCLADVMEKRSLLFLVVILIGEGSCLATYFITTYRQLYWCRALTGCSVGGALPLIYSVLGDYYEPKERGWVSGAISIGCGAGIAVGQGAAGLLGPRFGWRMPFLVVSVPAMVCAVMVWICIPEVERGGGEKRTLHRASHDRNDERFESEGGEVEMAGAVEKNELDDANDATTCKMRRSTQATSRTTLVSGDSPKQGLYAQLNNQDSSGSLEDDTPTKSRYIFCGLLAKYYQKSLHPHLQTLKTLVQCPSVLLSITQGAPGCIPWGVINTYLNDYLSSDRGLSVESATLIILLFGFGNFQGALIGGMGSSYLYERYGPRYPALLSSGSAIAGCFGLWAIINFNVASNEGEKFNFYLLGLISILAGILAGITGPIVKATLQNVTMPHMRGQAFALLNTFDDFGRGLGPAFVALMIEKFGRRMAFNIGTFGWLFCGMLNGLLFFTAEADEEKVRIGVEQLVAEKEEAVVNNNIII